MAENSRQLPRTVWLGFSLLTGLMGLAYLVALAQLNRAQHPPMPVLGQIADFTLTNQNGQVTTLMDLTNHVWVADIIFTRCAGPCPRMTKQMESLQALLPATSAAKLVTLTTDPDFDTPPVMQKYSERFHADASRWFFLTGTKKGNRRARQRQLEVGLDSREAGGSKRCRRLVYPRHLLRGRGQARAIAGRL